MPLGGTALSIREHQRVLDALRTGQALRLREATGLTRADLSRHLGVSELAVLRWERGERRPRMTGPAGAAYLRWLKDLLDEQDALSG